MNDEKENLKNMILKKKKKNWIFENFEILDF